MGLLASTVTKIIISYISHRRLAIAFIHLRIPEVDLSRETGVCCLPAGLLCTNLDRNPFSPTLFSFITGITGVGSKILKLCLGTR